MASNQNFRSAFNGFNRQDVVNYISYMTTKHENQLNQLHCELDDARAELAAKENAANELEALRAQVESLLQQLQEKDAQLEALRSAPKAEAEPVAAPAAEVSFTEQELNAYRRAESAERRAMERVDRMYDRANGVVADAAARMDESAELVSSMADRVLGNLEALQNAVREGKTVLAESARLLAAVRPEKE